MINVFARGEGHTLRMPKDELEAWQTVNAKGKVTQLPRPADAVRTWNAEARVYEPFEIHLAGAPDTEVSPTPLPP